MSHYLIQVECHADSHAPRVAIAGHLSHQGGRTHSGASILIDEIPVSNRDVFGSSTTAPNMETLDRYTKNGRARNEFECRLCGLRVEMRDETAQRLVEGLIRTADWDERQVSEPGDDTPTVIHMLRLNLKALAASL